MTDELARKPSVIDGVEHGDATWRCSSCGRGRVHEPFLLPHGWMRLTLETGHREAGYRDIVVERVVRLLCPPCAAAFQRRERSESEAHKLLAAAAELPEIPASRRRRPKL